MSQHDLSGDEADAADEDAADADEEEYKRTTMYLRESLKKDYDHWFKKLELNMVDGVDSGLCDEAERREMHEATIRLVMQHPEAFVDEVESVMFDDSE